MACYSDRVTATHADALAVLREQVPTRIYRFAELVATGLAQGQRDVLESAAEAVGAPGEGTRLMADARASKVLHAILGADGESFRDTRLGAIQMLTQLCGYDPGEAFDNTNQPLPIRDMPPSVRCAIEGYKVKADGTVEIKFVKRLDALRLLLAYFADIENKALAVGGTATVVFRGRGKLEE